MKKTTRLIVLMTLIGIVLTPPAQAAIEEGMMIDGAEGIVRKVPDVDVWQFIPTKAIELSDEMTLQAYKPLSLLPCSVLEQMTEMAGDVENIEVRLWAMFTNYQQNNFLYSVYFLPVNAQAIRPDSGDDDDASKPEDDSEKQADTTEEESILPTEILEQIKSNKTPDLKKFQQLAQVTGDVNLINRSGYLKKSGKIKYFQPDAFGRNIDRNQYRLLPCEMLTTAERRMQQTPGRQRYSVSGLITIYKGQQYLLLRRAARTYTNGNFTP